MSTLIALLIVRGMVFDPSGLPVAGALVQLKGTTLIAVTNDAGEFILNTPERTVTLIVTMPGFATREIQSSESSLRIQLELARATEEVSVRGTLPSGPEPGSFAVTPIDVVRTPGSQADVFRALQMLPGVSRIDEGAGLFVRGGDVSEVLVLLDGITMAHPYRYETPTGGFRGSIDPFMTEGLSFSSGGFSARYGNALSAVLDLHGLSRPEITQSTATAGLAQVSGNFATPLGDNAGIRISAQRMLPRLLFAVNPPRRQFDRYPGGWDMSINGALNSRTFGNLKVLGVAQRDHVGVELEKDSFSGFLHSQTKHQFIAASWLRPLSMDWQMTGAYGGDVYTDFVDVGVMTIDKTERRRTVRLDLEGPAGAWTIRTGIDADFARTSMAGTVPSRGGDFGGVGGSSGFLVDRDNWRAGSYVEASRGFGRFRPTIGIRADRFGKEKSTTMDPRASVVYTLTNSQRFRFATGIFHQAPSPLYFDVVRGAAQLPPMTANHYVAGYELGAAEDVGFLRIEGYYKRYRRLPLEDGTVGYTAHGYGAASGLDFFARRAWTRLELRSSVSWLDAQRRWTPAVQRERYPLPQGTWSPDFSIPLSAQVVANFAIVGPLAVGASWRAASGRPFTPVVGANRTISGFAPVYGEINSERLPHYQKLDLSSSLILPIRGGGVLILFASVDNVAGRENFFEYAYSRDYSARHPVITSSPRTFYFGMSMTK